MQAFPSRATLRSELGEARSRWLRGSLSAAEGGRSFGEESQPPAGDLPVGLSLRIQCSSSQAEGQP